MADPADAMLKKGVGLLKQATEADVAGNTPQAISLYLLGKSVVEESSKTREVDSDFFCFL